MSEKRICTTLTNESTWHNAPPMHADIELYACKCHELSAENKERVDALLTSIAEIIYPRAESVIKAGDVVRLKSGGTPMTVQKVNGGLVSVVFFTVAASFVSLDNININCIELHIP